MELAFTNLLIIVAAGFGAPLALGFFPSPPSWAARSSSAPSSRARSSRSSTAIGR
jgi:hypothetical protein